MTPIVVYGAGGLAREVEWLIRRINRVSPRWEFAGFVVTDRSRLGLHHSKERVIETRTGCCNATTWPSPWGSVPRRPGWLSATVCGRDCPTTTSLRSTIPRPSPTRTP